jgi:hypothetical protein
MTRKLYISLFILNFILLLSCKKKDVDSVLGLDVQPENDLVGVTVSDTASIFMYTQKVDSTRTYNDQYKYLGCTHDPIFGITEASIYTNFSITNNLTNVSFGPNAVLDSAEMIVRDLGTFNGDTSTILNYEVFLLNEKLQNDVLYYTTSKFSKSNAKINITNGRYVKRNDKMYLVMKLDPNFAQYILQTDANLVNNIAFQNAYKGFYITTASSSSTLTPNQLGAIRRMDLNDELSGVKFYYRNSNSTSSKGEEFLFSFRGSDALRTNYIKHNYNSAHHNLYSQVIDKDSLKGNANIYLNHFGGTRIRVYIPYINNFVDSQNVAINRAELIIKLDQTLAPPSIYYGTPAELALIASSSTGVEELVWDQLESTDFIKYGGNFDVVNKQYVFNIARQMQKIITKKIDNYGFYLVNANQSPSGVARRDNRAERVIFSGKLNANFKPTFKVTYVKFPYDK